MSELPRDISAVAEEYTARLNRDRAAYLAKFFPNASEEEVEEYLAGGWGTAMEKSKAKKAAFSQCVSRVLSNLEFAIESIPASWMIVGVPESLIDDHRLIAADMCFDALLLPDTLSRIRAIRLFFDALKMDGFEEALQRGIARSIGSLCDEVEMTIPTDIASRYTEFERKQIAAEHQRISATRNGLRELLVTQQGKSQLFAQRQADQRQADRHEALRQELPALLKIVDDLPVLLAPRPQFHA